MCFRAVAISMVTFSISGLFAYGGEGRWQNDDVLLKIVWCGTTSKPINQAGLATSSRGKELESWAAKMPSDCTFSAIISAEENRAVAKSLSKFDFVSRHGSPPNLAYGNSWCLHLYLGKSEQYADLGSSAETERVFRAIKACLRPEHQEPLNRVLESLETRLTVSKRQFPK